jgi:hypothetical protein
MEISFGLDGYKLSQGKNIPVTWNASQVSNFNFLVLGFSGSGKTHNLRKIINNFSKNAIDAGNSDFRVHVFDVHGDIKGVHESAVTYSENSDFGINPLVINDDPEHGGVRKRIQSFLNTIQNSTAKLGVRQEAVAESLLEDLYKYYGFYKDDPSSWGLDAIKNTPDDVLFLDVPFEKKDIARRRGARWNPGKKAWYVESSNYKGELEQFAVKDVDSLSGVKRYPTLVDAEKFIYTKMEEAFLGTGREAMNALKAFHKATAKMNKLLAKAHYSDGQTYMTSDEKEKLEKAKGKVRELVEEYLTKNPTEKTLKDALLYTSIDTLTAIHQRFKNMSSSGVFKDTPPPFDPAAPVHRHDIRPLSHEEQKMFVLFSLERIFETAVQRGESKEIRDVIVVDEASKFFDNDPRNPLNYIAVEGRKSESA